MKIFKGSKVTPVLQGESIPTYAHEHVIFFGKDELTNIGTTIQKIEEKGLPLGNPQRNLLVQESSFVDPDQKKLFRQRRKIFYHLMDETMPSSGNLLTNDIHQLRKMNIFEKNGSHRSFVWCGDSFD